MDRESAVEDAGAAFSLDLRSFRAVLPNEGTFVKVQALVRVM